MKPILVPSRTVTLPGGLRCASHTVPLAAWQAHVIKHPLGVNAIRKRAPWNLEAWDATAPPVVTDTVRAAVIARIQGLETASSKCGVRELRGGRTPLERGDKEPCYLCPPDLLPRCGVILGEPGGVGVGYAQAIDTLLHGVSETQAIEVPRLELMGKLASSLRRPGWIEAGLVAAVGMIGAPLVPGVRIARGDGALVELWLNGVDLVWKTTYRTPQISTVTRWSHLIDVPRPNPRLPLSDTYVVPRGWWESHGT